MTSAWARVVIGVLLFIFSLARRTIMGSFVHRRASFLVTNTLMQNLSNQSAQAVGNNPNRLVMPKARHVPTVKSQDAYAVPPKVSAACRWPDCHRHVGGRQPSAS